MGTALVAVLGVVIGVVLSNIGQLYLERHRRQVRIQDVATAIRAEIRSHRQRLTLFNVATADEVAKRILENAEYVPFVPKETPSFVMEAVVGEVILPTEAIDAVIYYYRQVAVLAQLAEDLRSDRFSKLEASRKAEAYRDYIAIGAYALQLADQALASLEDSLIAGPWASRAGNRRRRR